MFRTILAKMGLQEKVEPQQAKKKWDNLKKKKKKKYKVGAGLNGDLETKLCVVPMRVNK